MFKANWEKTSTLSPLPNDVIKQMVQLIYPDKKLISHDLFAGGCANLNIKILLEGQAKPLNLRVYIRDKDAAYREQKLAMLLQPSIPAPLTYYIGELDHHQFSITEFMPGISLRHLLLSDTAYNIEIIMHEVGTILSKISSYTFSQPGLFDKSLNVIPHKPSDNYLAIAKKYLNHETVLSVLKPNRINKIDQTIDQHSHLFPNENEKHLVHADFDPANILVNKIENQWKVSGILDWEFSFAGSPLFDVANMLRYAYKMPHAFQNSFSGTVLPENWETTINLLNLESLLDCLTRSNFTNQPHRCMDICELIDHILSELIFSN